MIIEVDTSDGVTGVSYVAAFTPGIAAAICALLSEVGDILVGEDATRIGAIWDRTQASLTLIGHTGISSFVQSGVNVALWDLQGRLLGVPVHRLLGTRRSQVPAYASEGCWLYDDRSRVIDDVGAFAAQGFRIVKLRFGRQSVDEDFATLEALAGTFGESIEYIVDVNQGWSRELAGRVVPRFTGLPVRWLEEPLAADDVVGLAQLRAALPIPLAAGENAYLPDGLARLLSHEAISVATPDIQRIGGISGWIRAAAMCEARRIPLSGHLFPEVSVHLLAAAATPQPLEWVSWLSVLMCEPLSITSGVAAVPERPGLGLEFDADAIRAHELK